MIRQFLEDTFHNIIPNTTTYTRWHFVRTPFSLKIFLLEICIISSSQYSHCIHQYQIIFHKNITFFSSSFTYTLTHSYRVELMPQHQWINQNYLLKIPYGSLWRCSCWRMMQGWWQYASLLSWFGVVCVVLCCVWRLYRMSKTRLFSLYTNFKDKKNSFFWV